MNYFHDMVDNIHQKRIWRPWNQCGSICLHLRRHIWNSRVHERSVTSSGHEGTPAWTKAKPSSSRRSHRKTYRPAEARTYHSCVELVIFIGKDSVHLKIQLCKYTAWSTALSPRVADDAGLAQFDFTRPVSRKKTDTRIIVTGGGGDCDTCRHDNVVTWQRRLWLLSIQTLNCFSWAEYWLLW